MYEKQIQELQGQLKIKDAKIDELIVQNSERKSVTPERQHKQIDRET